MGLIINNFNNFPFIILLIQKSKLNNMNNQIRYLASWKILTIISIRFYWNSLIEIKLDKIFINKISKW
jgi:ABC-type methionine transport system permease subunit